MRHLPDTNVWLALSLKGHVHHTIARAWFSEAAPDDACVLCRPTQQGLLRLLTTEAVMHAYNRPALSNTQAWAVALDWTGNSRVSFTHEPSGMEAIWQTLACRSTASPKLWMDAYLAAFAITGGFRLVTNDRAFKQFAGLDVLVLG
jgi:toxin-antitoxin system PIN domain toxin